MLGSTFHTAYPRDEKLFIFTWFWGSRIFHFLNSRLSWQKVSGKLWSSMSVQTLSFDPSSWWQNNDRFYYTLSKKKLPQSFLYENKGKQVDETFLPSSISYDLAGKSRFQKQFVLCFFLEVELGLICNNKRVLLNPHSHAWNWDYIMILGYQNMFSNWFTFYS